MAAPGFRAPADDETAIIREDAVAQQHLEMQQGQQKFDQQQAPQQPPPVYAPNAQVFQQQQQPYPGQPYVVATANGQQMMHPYYLQQAGHNPYTITNPNGDTVIMVTSPPVCTDAEYMATRDRARCLGWVSLFFGAIYCSIPALIIAYKDRATLQELKSSIKLSTMASIFGILILAAVIGLTVVMVNGMIPYY